MLPSPRMPGQNRTLTAVDGLRVGHWTDAEALTGCTVVVCDAPMVCGVDVRGPANGTRELDVCRVPHLTRHIHGLVLAGGSAYGLDAAGGVQREMERDGVGYPTSAGVVPLVPAAILYDLAIGDPTIRPGIEAGAAAYRAASTQPVPRGNVGAGTGATVGKLYGPARATKGGLGSVCLRAGDATVAALVAVNAFGDIRDPSTGKLIAGLRKPSGRGLADTAAQLRAGHMGEVATAGSSTVIGCVATNAMLGKEDAIQLARAGSAGLAQCLSPPHSPFDGDVIFGLGCLESSVRAPLAALTTAAAQAVMLAVLDGVRRAATAGGVPAAG